MKKHLSLHQRIHNAVGSQEVENVKAIHAYTHARNWPDEEWNNVWDRSDDCSWAHDFGRWRGDYKVRLNSIGEWDLQAFTTFKYLYRKYPDIIGKDPRSINVAPMHILCNEVIEVADDGKSARAAYMTPGHIYSYLRINGTRWATMMWEHYGSDFVCDEKSRWKYLHEQVCPDLGGGYDTGNWGLSGFEFAFHDGPLPPPDAPPEDDGGQKHDKDVDDPGPKHSPVMFPAPIEDLAPWPEPYAHMDNNNTYSPFVGKDHL